MLHYIKGPLVIKGNGYIVVETGGIGFEISVPSNSRFYLAQEGEEVCVYTYLQVREDDMSLFGFDDRAGLEVFKKLITVNGVGAKAAIAVLSAMPLSELKKAIVFEDVQMITRANGVGKKTAQRIVLDLKDQLDEVLPDTEELPTAAGAAEMPDQGAKAEALDALMALGYTRSEAASALLGMKEEMSVEEYIKAALSKI